MDEDEHAATVVTVGRGRGPPGAAGRSTYCDYSLTNRRWSPVDGGAVNLRSSETPSAPSLASLGPGHPYGNVGLLTRSWTVYGMQWAVEGLVWIGTAATNADIATIDAVLQSITYDEPL